MKKTRQRLWQILGVIGTALCIGIFIRQPSFPTPDKLIIFLFFIFLIFHQAWAMLRRLLPFVVLLLLYESFRGIAHSLNTHVNYTLAPQADRLIFGGLPTVDFQHWLWHGHTMWYDFVFYIPYMLFFIIPISLAILVWKTREKHYWEVVTTHMVVFFGGFLTFLFFPAAPPWMASQNHYIQPIERVSSDVWFSLGIRDFPSLYNHLAPNPVAAVPSLHAAIATLLPLFIFKLYGRRWGTLALLYPALIYVGVIYQGEHYAFDVILGAIYAAVGYLIGPHLLNAIKKTFKKISMPKLPFKIS